MPQSPSVKYLQLPFQFDESQLRKDLNTITDQSWHLHYNKMDYRGNWTSVTLYAPNGESQNNFASADVNMKLQATSIMAYCPYLQAVIQTFQCPLLSVRLLKLAIGSIIKPHRDFRLGYEDDNFRIHIPITTNDQVSFVLGGEQLRMLPGECWYTNVNFTHSVANNGSTDRVHLVIDGERNAWSDELFFSLAPRAQFNLPEDRQAYKQHILETIKGLKEIGTPKAEEMIRELEKRLALSE